MKQIKWGGLVVFTWNHCYNAYVSICVSETLSITIQS